MNITRIQAGAVLYYAKSPHWRAVPPQRVVVVDAGPYRVTTVRQGAVYLTTHMRDPNGTAVLVAIDGRQRAVYARDLRGPWLETLAATGRTEAQVEEHRAALAAIARRPGPVTADDVLGLAVNDPMDDDTFTAIARAVDDTY